MHLPTLTAALTTLLLSLPLASSLPGYPLFASTALKTWCQYTNFQGPTPGGLKTANIRLSAQEGWTGVCGADHVEKLKTTFKARCGDGIVMAETTNSPDDCSIVYVLEDPECALEQLRRYPTLADKAPMVKADAYVPTECACELEHFS